MNLYEYMYMFKQFYNFRLVNNITLRNIINSYSDIYHCNNGYVKMINE